MYPEEIHTTKTFHCFHLRALSWFKILHDISRPRVWHTGQKHCWKSTVIPSLPSYTRQTMFLWTGVFKPGIGEHCFVCWTPKKGLSVSVTQLAILTKEAKPLNTRQYPTSFSSQQGRLNKRRQSISDQGSFHSQSFSHQDWRQQKEAGDPNTRGCRHRHVLAVPRCIPEVPLDHFLQIQLLQCSLLGEGWEAPFTAKGTRWLHRAPRLACTGQGGMLGLIHIALYGFNYKFFSLRLTLAIKISGDSYNRMFSINLNK